MSKLSLSHRPSGPYYLRAVGGALVAAALTTALSVATPNVQAAEADPEQLTWAEQESRIAAAAERVDTLIENGASDAAILEAKKAIPLDSVPQLRDAAEAPDTEIVPLTCMGNFWADGDYVHKSVYDGIAYASGHGWWDASLCTDRADKVTIYLNEKLGGTWYVQGNPGIKTGSKAGSGTGKWATAKMRCVNNTLHTWRSQVTAKIDTGLVRYKTTAARNIRCY